MKPRAPHSVAQKKDHEPDQLPNIQNEQLPSTATSSPLDARTAAFRDFFGLENISPVTVKISGHVSQFPGRQTLVVPKQRKVARARCRQRSKIF